MKFEGVRVFVLPFKRFKEGAAFALPGIGIFIGKGYETDYELLRHEFGHLLQYRKWGFWLFWKHIALDSFKSARKARKHAHNHMHTWTEWSANRLAYEYFNKPADWDQKRYPIMSVSEGIADTPKFTKNNEDFLKNWVEA
ncbi:MAG: hypothetical protein GX361_07975 [Bacteroidales bacterium]|nr:hypothetical protein [Bacteroidales bacterium]